jgi:hypothetical protein
MDLLVQKRCYNCNWKKCVRNEEGKCIKCGEPYLETLRRICITHTLEWNLQQKCKICEFRLDGEGKCIKCSCTYRWRKGDPDGKSTIEHDNRWIIWILRQCRLPNHVIVYHFLEKNCLTARGAILRGHLQRGRYV